MILPSTTSPVANFRIAAASKTTISKSVKCLASFCHVFSCCFSSILFGPFVCKRCWRSSLERPVCFVLVCSITFVEESWYHFISCTSYLLDTFIIERIFFTKWSIISVAPEKNGAEIIKERNNPHFSGLFLSFKYFLVRPPIDFCQLTLWHQ